MTLLAIRKSPFLERDGGLRLKLGGAFAIVTGVFMLWALSGGMMLDGADLDELSAWREWDPPGRPLVAFSLQLLIFVVGLGATLLGAASIAEERDRGTWREILLTPLSPGDIVLGKAAALTTTLLPFAILTAPVVAWGALVGDVSFVDVLLATGLAMLHVPFFASLGLAVSAHASSVRQATTSAVFAFLAVGVVPVFVPGSVLVGLIADRGFFPTYVPEAVAHVAVLVTGTLGCLMVARERIATRGQNGFRARRRLVMALLALPPTLLALPLHFRDDMASRHFEVFDFTSIALIGTAALVLVGATLLLDVASSPTPRRTAIVDGSVAALSLTAGGLTLAFVAPGFRDLVVDTSMRMTLGLGIALPFVAAAWSLAGIAAVVAARRGASATAAFAALAFIVVTTTVATFIGLSGLPSTDGFGAVLLSMNPAASVAALVENTLVAAGAKEHLFTVPPSTMTVACGLSLHLAIAFVGLLAAGRGRRGE